VSVIQQALAHRPASRCALLQASQAAAHPFAFCLPPSASVSLFGVTASFQLGPAPIMAPCDALRGQGQRCVRPTHATQHFQYEHSHFVGSRFVSAAHATPPIDDPRALVAHPASTNGPEETGVSRRPNRFGGEHGLLGCLLAARHFVPRIGHVLIPLTPLSPPSRAPAVLSHPPAR